MSLDDIVGVSGHLSPGPGEPASGWLSVTDVQNAFITTYGDHLNNSDVNSAIDLKLDPVIEAIGELGEASGYDLGTTADSVAAGDDPRFIQNVASAPTTNPGGLGIAYALAGELYWRAPNGHVTKIAGLTE